MADTAESLARFWRDAGRERWFRRDDAFDKLFRDRFMALHLEAAARAHDDWVEAPESALALLILLDQFPRNAFRGTAHMYATDPLALMFADRALALGHDARVEETLKHALVHRDIIARFGRFPHRNPAFERMTTSEEQAFLDVGGVAG